MVCCRFSDGELHFVTENYSRQHVHKLKPYLVFFLFLLKTLFEFLQLKLIFNHPFFKHDFGLFFFVNKCKFYRDPQVFFDDV